MADELEKNGIDEEKNEPVRKKKNRKGLIFLSLLLAVVGGLVGLVVSGIWDARPMFYGLIPKVPYIGSDLAAFFDVPKVYTLTLEERRRYELHLWQDDLVEREKKVENLSISLEKLSQDLELKEKQLKTLEGNLEAKVPKKEESQELSEKEQEIFQRVVRTYQEISARRAAKIVENLSSPLAVKILRSLPEEDGGKILGRMDAAKAAWLTEQLTKTGQ